MAIQKTGSRRIVVDTVAYRWTVRPRPSYAQGLAQNPLSFVVELEHAGKTTLVVTTDVFRPDNWVLSRSGIVTPAVVERGIRKALQQGWQPAAQGSPHTLSIAI